MKFRIALIGCGRISFKHIEAYVNNKNRLDLVAVCDPILDKASEKAKEYQEAVSGSKVMEYADYREMLDK